MTRALSIAALVVASLALVLSTAALMTAGAARREIRPTAPLPVPPVVQPAPQAKVEPKVEPDPWPECAACREWLRKFANDPKVAEVVSWDKRTPVKDGATIETRVRDRTRRGGVVVMIRYFAVQDGRVISSSFAEIPGLSDP